MNYPSFAYLLAPEICLVGFAIIAILLDLFIGRKKVLAALGIVALLASVGFSLSLWLGHAQPSTPLLGGVLVVDSFALFFNILVAAAAILVVLSSIDYASKFSRFQGEYYALILLSAVGMMLMAASRDLISVYVSLELASLSLYALVGFLKDDKSTEASLKYLLLGAVASATLLFGMALVYGLTGQTNLAGIADSLLAGGVAWSNPVFLLAVVFLIAGFGFKISSIPFQMWVPDVYEGAPTPVTAYLSIASKAAGFAVIMRVFLEALGSAQANWALIFAILSAFSMVIGNTVAIAQTNIKRMLGYSTIAQAGYLMVGLATVTELGQSGLLFFLASYAVANLGAFIAIIAISEKVGSDLISDFSGMGKRAPVLALALTLCLISLTGIPPTAGFVAKLYLFNAAVHYNLVWLVVVAVLNTAISAYYYFRVIKVMWFSTPASEERVTSSWTLRVALAIACLGVLVLFFYPGALLGVARSAVAIFP